VESKDSGKEISTMIRPLSIAVAVATVCATGPGCGPPPGNYPVSGKVLYRGEPAAGAVVYFHREDAAGGGHRPIPSGIVEDDGSFYLTSDGVGDGCPAGKYSVLVEWKGKPDPQAKPPEPGRGKVKLVRVNRRSTRNGVDRLRGRYFDIARPLLHADVKEGSNQLPTFELTD
jgi:hypothetical protein